MKPNTTQATDQQCIDFFRDYFNNYLTVDRIAADHGITTIEAQRRIDLGRRLHDENAERLKAQGA